VAHNNLGNALLVAGRIPEAIEHYQQALLLQPDYLQADLNLATAYLRSHQNEKAINAAQKGLDLARSRGDNVQSQKIQQWLLARRTTLARPQ
jgi:tetratricopeptide (TPR) repeat protein